jgi:hypothetical protein
MNGIRGDDSQVRNQPDRLYSHGDYNSSLVFQQELFDALRVPPLESDSCDFWRSRRGYPWEAISRIRHILLTAVLAPTETWEGGAPTLQPQKRAEIRDGDHARKLEQLHRSAIGIYRSSARRRRHAAVSRAGRNNGLRRANALLSVATKRGSRSIRSKRRASAWVSPTWK